MSKNNNTTLNMTDTLAQELQELSLLKESDIDCSDIPEINFTKSKNEIYRGHFYRPVKQSVTLRLDADVIAWFKDHYPKYQTAINQALRGHVMRQG